MDGINFNYLTLATAVVNILLGLLVLQDDAKSKLNRLFFIFTTSLFVWASVNFITVELYTNVVLFRATYSTGGLALVLALPWILVFLGREPTVLIKNLIFVLAAVVFLIPFLGGLVIVSIGATPEGLSFISGPVFNIYGGLLVVILFYLLYLLATSFRKSSGTSKLQIGYTLLGISIFSAVSFTFGVVMPLFNYSPVVAFDAQSSLIWVGLTAYAITRHKLFNVKLIAAQSFVGLIVLALLTRIFTARTTSDAVLESIILLAVVIIGIFLVRSVADEVSRREQVEKLAQEKTRALSQLEERNKNLATLQRISKLVLDEIELKSMAQKILDEIPKQLPNTVGALLNLVVGGNMKAYAMTQNELSTKLSELIGDDLEKFNYPIQESFNKLHATLISKEIQHSDTLSDFVSPPINKPVAVTAQKLLGIKHLVAIPMFSGKSPLGVILFAYKVPHTNLEAKELEMAQAIADDFSLAIQRAEAFQKLKDANEYLAQMDKMKDEFISIASHELNTPLAAVEGYLSMILDEGMGKVDAKAKEYLKRAYSSSRRLADLIMDLLNVSRIEQGRVKMKFTKNNLYDLADSVVKELQVKANAKKLKLTLEGKKSDVPETYCDPDRIREVFVNLVGNSIKYTEKGTIQVKIHGDHSKIVSEVTDTGRGISAQDQKKLFQKFSQVKREIDEHQGTGLGLYISKNFVEIHKGRIYVESEEGKGSTFAFELPIMKEPPKKVEGAILETNISAPQIESGEKDVPSVITASKKSS